MGLFKNTMKIQAPYIFEDEQCFVCKKLTTHSKEPKTNHTSAIWVCLECSSLRLSSTKFDDLKAEYRRVTEGFYDD